jgi:4-hydroxy-tetrahydrodipicolinate synthase
MNPLKSSEIFGTWGTVLLPINQDESIDYTRLANSIDTLISSGVNGIYSNGTAGEFYNQTEDEFDQISEILAQKCTAASLPYQIGCSHTNPLVSLKRVKRAKAFAPGALQIILPDWFPPTLAEVVDYLQVMAKAAYPIGLVLYNPPYAKKKLTPSDLYVIKEAGINLVGCKTAGGDVNWYAEMKNLIPELSLFVPGHHLATGIKDGSYSNVACIDPTAAQKWFDLMQTDMEKALELQTRIQHFMKKCIFPLIEDDHYSDPAIDKFLAAISGWANVGARLRWPYRWIDKSKAENIRISGQQIIPEFFR